MGSLIRVQWKTYCNINLESLKEYSFEFHTLLFVAIDFNSDKLKQYQNKLKKPRKKQSESICRMNADTQQILVYKRK